MTEEDMAKLAFSEIIQAIYALNRSDWGKNTAIAYPTEVVVNGTPYEFRAVIDLTHATDSIPYATRNHFRDAGQKKEP